MRPTQDTRFSGSRECEGRRCRDRFRTPDGLIFCRTDIWTITDARCYCFDDLGSDDIVVDIGANAGAFCIRAAKAAGKVTAVEPVTADILSENIRRNRVPVQVIEGALGPGGVRPCTWDGRTVMSDSWPLREICDMAGGCDFLKADCEGAEWSIEPGDMAGIRRIEMELHIPPISGPVNRRLLSYLGEHFHYRIDRIPCHGELGVMGVLHGWRKD